jgi:hypothetical protein
MDPHIQRIFAWLLPSNPMPKRVKAFFGFGLYYFGGWYWKQWLPKLPLGGPAGVPPKLRGHWYFIEARSRQLARTLFHQMLRYQQGLEKKQMILFRLVDAGVDLFTMAATISLAAQGLSPKGTVPKNAVELAGLFCVYAEGRVKRSLAGFKAPEDRLAALRKDARHRHRR